MINVGKVHRLLAVHVKFEGFPFLNLYFFSTVHTSFTAITVNAVLVSYGTNIAV